MKNTTMSIYAEALSANRDYKNARIDGKTVGVRESRAWGNAVKALRIPAYTVAKYRHDNMGKADIANACDLSPLYSALHTVLDLVGEVNGAKLQSANCAETIITLASRLRVIDLTPEMAHARLVVKQARDDMREDETDETVKAYEDAVDAMKALEEQPGNCRRNFEIQSDSAFVKAVEIALGDAINGQLMRDPAEILAEEEARRQARRAKTAAKKAAKKNA